MAYLQESKGRYSITVPARIVKFLGWQKGDNIQLKLGEKGKVLLEKE